mmetsp:Transcript_6246/g.9170  ORF Transcript_6246/g.9170 Transcript_6246/m.9170 type:complete len:109 (+) Transcript_6246:113-439(+)
MIILSRGGASGRHHHTTSCISIMAQPQPALYMGMYDLIHFQYMKPLYMIILVRCTYKKSIPTITIIIEHGGRPNKACVATINSMIANELCVEISCFIYCACQNAVLPH